MADDAENMSFLAHLEQLRKVLQKILIGDDAHLRQHLVFFL